MKVEDLKNTKIYLSNEKDRIKFQKKVFKLGVKWKDGTIEICYVEYEFYYIDSDFKMTMDGGTGGVNWFLRKRNRQIFLEDVLAIEEPKIDFKPFDKVLVRDYMDAPWQPRFFAWHNVDYKEDYPYPFETTDGYFYKYCIPYDEDLANITKSKEE